jgi:hypothetical protein
LYCSTILVLLKRWRDYQQQGACKETLATGVCYK